MTPEEGNFDYIVPTVGGSGLDESALNADMTFAGELSGGFGPSPEPVQTSSPVVAAAVQSASGINPWLIIAVIVALILVYNNGD